MDDLVFCTYHISEFNDKAPLMCRDVTAPFVRGRVPNASDDLPEPDMPVNTTKASRGTSTSIFLRLFWRAPRTCTQAGGPVCP